MTKKLRVGVIGLGMGRAHITSYNEHRQASVVAIADPDAGRRKAIGEEFTIPGRYATAEEMLARERLDVVSIATPNCFHCDLALKAFKAGCHVLCEKPMALNARDGQRMVAAAKKAQRRLMINFSFRFTPASWGLKKQVDKGALGEVYFGRTVWHRHCGMPGFGGWFGIKALSGGGSLIDLGVHRLDQALWLMGYPEPEYVLANTYDHIAGPLAKTSGKKFDVEDLAAGFIRFKNGATLVVEASWAGPFAEAEFMETRLMGNHAALVQRTLEGTYKFEGELIRTTRKNKARVTPIKDAKAPSFARHFIQAIVTDTPHLATGEEGVIVMKILDALYRSAQTGKPIQCGR